jgi:hypothetical protein
MDLAANAIGAGLAIAGIELLRRFRGAQSPANA